MKKSIYSYLVVLAGVTLFSSASTYAKDGVSFLEPKNGATVTSPFKVKFGIEGMNVVPAGSLEPKTGHHHIVINGESVAEGQAIPFDAKHLHFGKAQTEAEVTLPPGKYSLTMQFGNGAHQSYGKAMSSTIQVVVK